MQTTHVCKTVVVVHLLTLELALRHVVCCIVNGHLPKPDLIVTDKSQTVVNNS